MARSSDPKKLALWQGRFQRFLDSGLAVARFCAVEDVAESSFYYWQKKLGPQVLRRPACAEDHGTCAEDHGTCAEDHGARADDCGAGSEDHGVFRPVTVMPATCGVVVRLPGGTRIEVDADHLDAIRAVVAETVRVDQGRAAHRNVSSNNQVTRKAFSNNRGTRKASSNVTGQPCAIQEPKAIEFPQCPACSSEPRASPRAAVRWRFTLCFQRKPDNPSHMAEELPSNNRVIRKASSDNQVIRKRGGTVSC